MAPRFTHDAQGNIYVAAIIDSLLLTPADVAANAPIPSQLVNYPQMIAKFDTAGHRMRSTISQRYADYQSVTGLSLTPDQQLIVTGNYTGENNFSSRQLSPVILQTGAIKGNFISGLDTAGNVRWMEDVPAQEPMLNVFLAGSGSGSVYTVGLDSAGLVYQAKYNVNSRCSGVDIAALGAPCTTRIVLGIDATAEINATLFPIPNNGKCFVYVQDPADAVLKIYDSYGTLVHSRALQSNGKKSISLLWQQVSTQLLSATIAAQNPSDL